MNVEIWAIIAAIMLALLVVFQIALIFGAPLGNYAWGGKYKVLPLKLRISSALSVFLYAVFVYFGLVKAGLIPGVEATAFTDTFVWIVFGYLALGIFMNAISRSKPERYTMTPVALVLAVCFFFIAAA